MNADALRFTARAVAGSGRGRGLGTPTINVDLADVPAALKDGIYACRVSYDGEAGLPGALHYGPRPVHNDSVSCEVHLLDRMLDAAPSSIMVEIVERLRDVQDFTSEQELIEQMEKDIAQVREILKA